MSNYYMGIDASKGYADFIVVTADKKPVEAGFQLDDTARGHKKLTAWLEDFFADRPDAVLYAAIESTGGYENNWYNRLKTCSKASTFSLHVARVNPAWIKFNSEASARKNKTDAISAKDVAEYQIVHPGKVVYDEDDYPTLRRQWTLIRMYQKQKTQLLNQLESFLYGSMPELLTFCRQGAPTWLLKLLTRYPSYQDIQQAGVAELSKIAYISKQKARLVIDRLQDGVGLCDQVTAQVLKSLTEQILHMDKLIQQQKRFLEKSYQEAKDDTELLLTFQGIGVYSAVGLLLNIIDARRFQAVKKLASYFGLHPVYKKSGDGVWGMHMSKAGRAEPRAILYMVTFSAIQYNPIIKELYARCLAKGMHKSAAIGVCMHKTLRIVYGMLKNKTAFDPDVDRKNREKTKEEKANGQKQPAAKKARRLQGFDENAPTSRRQQKNRKEQAPSQDEKLVVNGVAGTAPSEVLIGGVL